MTEPRFRNDREPKSKVGRTLDTIKAIVIGFVTISALLILGAFYYIAWTVLAEQSRQFVQAWAIVASTLLPLLAIATFAVGCWVGLKQANLIADGFTQMGDQLLRAAADVADVRIYAAGKYSGLGLLGGESKNSQEFRGNFEVQAPPDDL